MAAKKKARRANPMLLLIRALPRSAVLPMLMVAAMVIAGGLLWRHYRDDIYQSEPYQLSADNVHATSPPEWIHSDVRGEAVRSAGIEQPVSILEEDLTERIARAFELHPWVARVDKVTKFHPARVEVEVVYRRPACVVEVPGGLYAVDEQGVLLPSEDFSPAQTQQYPRVRGIDRAPLGLAGSAWGDARVTAAAQVASVLRPLWTEGQFTSIAPLPTSDLEAPAQFELLTRDGGRIEWGHAPGAEIPDEPTAEAKLARLKEYFQQQAAGPSSTSRLDLRHARSANAPLR